MSDTKIFNNQLDRLTREVHDLRDRLTARTVEMEFLYARQLHDGPGLRMDNKRCRGRSADALAWYGVGMRDEPTEYEYPRDRSDLAACERTCWMAPEHVAERMQPVMAKYVAAVERREAAHA